MICYIKSAHWWIYWYTFTNLTLINRWTKSCPKRRNHSTSFGLRIAQSTVETLFYNCTNRRYIFIKRLGLIKSIVWFKRSVLIFILNIELIIWNSWINFSFIVLFNKHNVVSWYIWWDINDRWCMPILLMVLS